MPQTVPAEMDGRPLDAVVRGFYGLSHGAARKAVETGKVSLDGDVITHPTQRVTKGTVVVLDPTRPRPHVRKRTELERSSIVFVDGSVVVVRKPAGVMTVPFGNESPEEAKHTLDALVREILAHRTNARGRAPLGVVHRLDKETSGLLVFTRTLAAKKHLSDQFRHHTTKRRYVAIVHGDHPPKKTYRSTLVADRGDGLRGSTAHGRPGGQLAITHVETIERFRGRATLVSCRLETGRTHQIRIHLSEAGHPLVGESVYVRNYRGERIAAPRMMLHATELGFVHPATEQLMSYSDPPPPDFEAILRSLRATRVEI